MKNPAEVSPPLLVELEALRSGAAVAVPGQRAVLGASGPDAREWLERLVSSPVGALAPGRCAWTTLMDGKGKLRADLRVIRAPWPGGQDGDPWLLDVPAKRSAALLRTLDMFILREKVALHDGGASHAWLAVLGPKAAEALERAGLPCPAGDEAVSSAELKDAPFPCLVVASRLYGAPGADLLVPAGAVAEAQRVLHAAGCLPASLPALDVLRIEAGVPWFEEDLSDGVIPLEAGLDGHVSITKGCYPGQEVVARITNLGQVARKLVRLEADAPPGSEARAAPSPGTVLRGTGEREGQEAGRITSAAVDPATGHALALGFLRRPYLAPGTVVVAAEARFKVAGDARC